MQANTIVLAAMSLAPGLLYGQFDFKLAGRGVQIHSFASQGFAYSNQNNYLTLKTSDGSGAFTDSGSTSRHHSPTSFASGLSFTTGTSGNSAIGVPA